MQRFSNKRNNIPNLTDAQIVLAFQNGCRDNDLVKKIGRKNHDGRMTAAELFKIANQYARGNSALGDARKDKNSKSQHKTNTSQSGKEEKKPKGDSMVASTSRAPRKRPNKNSNQEEFEEFLDKGCIWHDGKHTNRECFKQKRLARVILQNSDKQPAANTDQSEDKGGPEDPFQSPKRDITYIYGGPDAYASKRNLKLARAVSTVGTDAAPATPQYLKWSEVPITFSRADHPDYIPRPGRYPLVLSPTVAQARLGRVLIDGGSCLNIILAKTFSELGIPHSDLRPSRAPFHGMIPGTQALPLGQIALPVTFGTRENFRTETVTFEVADFETSYHAILGRPALAKFMAVPHYTYMMLKMPAPNGVLSLRADVKTSFSCDAKSCELAQAQVAQAELKELK